MKKKVLFICTHNSARSQMAEAWLRALAGDKYDVFSAGTNPSRVHPLAIKVMAEVGIDIKNHASQKIDEFLGQQFDYVITVCDQARERCPFFPGARNYLHQSFPDPSQTAGSEEEKMASFRRVRDLIHNWLEKTFLDSPS